MLSEVGWSPRRDCPCLEGCARSRSPTQAVFILRSRRILAACLSVLSASFAAGTASAQPFDLRDGDGRVVHFDAPDQAAANALGQTVSALIHGNEVSAVAIRVVSPSAVAATCGADAAGCFQTTSRGASTIVVPTGDRGSDVLTHEYGHHIEQSRRKSFTALGSGVPTWWRARGVDALLQAGQVARDYALGWERSISEVFAEDYAALNGSTRRWRMMVEAPTPDILAALRADLVGAAPSPAAPTPGTPAPAPVGASPPPAAGASSGSVQTPNEVRTRGRLAPGGKSAFPFTVPGAGNGIVVGIRLAGRSKGASARADIRCGGKPLGGKAGRIKRPISFRVAGPGPAACTLVVSRASAPIGFSATVRVTPPAAGTR